MTEEDAVIWDCFTKQMSPREIKSKYSGVTFPTILRIQGEWRASNVPVVDFGSELDIVGSEVRRLDISAEAALREDMLTLASNLTKRANYLTENAGTMEMIPLSGVIVNLAIAIEKLAPGQGGPSGLAEFINED